MRRANDMPWLKRGIPIFDDVRFGKGGIAGGKFVQNDGNEQTYIVTSGTAQSGTSSTITLASTASSTDDAYNTYRIELTGGTGSGQDHQRITDYDGTTKVATLSGAWTTVPDSTSTYRVVP